MTVMTAIYATMTVMTAMTVVVVMALSLLVWLHAKHNTANDETLCVNKIISVQYSVLTPTTGNTFDCIIEAIYSIT